MSATPNLQLPFLDANQNQKHVTHNAALTILDALVNCNVQSTALDDAARLARRRAVLDRGGGGTGAWAGKDATIAAWQDGAWSFYAPETGFSGLCGRTSPILLVWNGTAWAPVAPAAELRAPSSFKL